LFSCHQAEANLREGMMTPEAMQQWAQTGLMWVGFGTVVGLVAKGVLPGRDSGGAVATVILGILGTLIGVSLVAFFWGGVHVTPFSGWGFLAGTLGSVVLLVAHRLLSGGFFREAGTGEVNLVKLPKRRRFAAVTRDRVSS
jgi:uncharacterized membrane protein YeaQ/YmgE (transglycosylase-associated protein family)